MTRLFQCTYGPIDSDRNDVVREVFKAVLDQFPGQHLPKLALTGFELS